MGIREVLEEWKNFEFPEIIPRYIEPKISNDIVAVIGPRRVGKTYLLLSLARELLKKFPKDNVLYINFDDERVEKDFEEFLHAYSEVFTPEKRKKIIFFLDEVQMVKNWSGWLRTLHNQRKYHIFVAGSTSKLLSREISTSLRGRYVSYLLLPFSFLEFLKVKKISLDNEAKVKKYLNEYIEFGGFPEVILEENRFEKRRKLASLYETIFFKDIVERYKIRNYDVTQKVLEILITNYSNRVTITKLYNFLNSSGIKIAKKTLWRYFHYFEDSLSLFVLNPMVSSRRQILLPRKIYSVDTGVSIFLSGKRDMGRIIENIVYLELLRRRERELFEVFYFLRNGLEVDFVVKQGAKVKELIQVCYDIENFSTKMREVKSLLRVSEFLKCNNMLVITWDYEGEEKIEGKKIRYIPLWKWLSLARKSF